MRNRTILSLLVACCAPATAALAQRTVIYDNATGTTTVIDGAPAPVLGAAALQPAAPATQPTTQPVPATPEQQRLATLLAVKYDRKAPAVLAALAPKTQPATRPATLPAGQAGRLKSDVESGNWKGVGERLAALPPADAQKVHANIVQQLAQDPQTVMLPDDVLDLAAALPIAPTEPDVTGLGRLLAVALRRNNSPQPLVARLEAGVGHYGGKDPKNRANAAALLYAANRLLEGGPFLAPLEPALAKKETETIDLHARHQQALATAAAGRGDQAGYAALMRRAWDLTQTVLREAKADAKERDAAFQRSLQLLQTLPKELGNAFLRDSFKSRPQDGHKLLTHLASQIAQQAPDPARMQRGGGGGGDFNGRLQLIQLQHRIVGELLATVSGDELKPWRTPLNLMAIAWLTEAEWSKQRYQKRDPYQQSYVRYGPYGVYEDQMMQQQRQNPNEPQPIPPEQLTESAPTPQWVAALDATLAPRIRGGLAEMKMKADEVDDVLPIVEQVAPEHPRLAHALATELLRTWARVKNPNQNRYGNYDPYYYNPYQSTQGIALTRLAQERNLRDLSDMLGRLKKLSIDPIDESTVVAAFAAAHSSAEVYRINDVELVFGRVESMGDKTLASFVQTMRQRLARDWRQPQVQQQAKTKRTDKDVEAEVARGYETLLKMLDRRADSPDWRTHGARGSVLYDLAEFEYGKKVPLAVYTKKRDAAFAAFRKSLEIYLSKLPTLEESEQTAQPWQQYFNAALGSSDLQYLTRQDEPDKDHIDRIRDSLFALPENVRERHVSQFGKGLTDNLPGIPAELKARYLRVGVRIMGDHPSAEEARNTVQYYKDLTTEAELHVRLDAKDNDTAVGHARPFGAFVSLRHTIALGRESGGFQKYLMNPASGRNYYYYGGGQQPKNHRDAFEKKIREALVEHFDIVSITFHDEKIEPRGFGRPDWRETPLAYLLLKAKDAKTDRIPPIQLDLEFADKRGPVVLPIESNLLLVDARPADVAPKPLTNLAVTQILDGRDAARGKLNLEVKATGNGLVPELSELLDPNVPGLRLDKTDGQPLVITKLDTEAETLAPVTERTWMVSYSIADDAPADLAFKFPAVKTPGATLVYKRYADADLEDVSERVALAGVRLRKSPWWKWPAIALGVLAAAGVAILVILRANRRHAVVAPAYQMPRVVNPFTVVDLLSRMHSDQTIGLTPPLREQLLADIRAIEKSHFADANGNGNRDGNGHDTVEVARRWLARAGA